MRADLTRGEIELWLLKLAKDAFSQHGQDVRQAVRDATYYGLWTGKRQKPDDFLIKFGKKKAVDLSPEALRAVFAGYTTALGGEVTKGETK